MPVIVTVHTVFHSRYILIALLLGAGASASAGDRIVFSNRGGQRVVFEFDQKKEAEKRATELSKGGKAPHFVQKVKEEIKPE